MAGKEGRALRLPLSPDLAGELGPLFVLESGDWVLGTGRHPALAGLVVAKGLTSVRSQTVCWALWERGGW